jgi:hypothetical protein
MVALRPDHSQAAKMRSESESWAWLDTYTFGNTAS